MRCRQYKPFIKYVACTGLPPDVVPEEFHLDYGGVGFYRSRFTAHDATARAIWGS